MDFLVLHASLSPANLASKPSSPLFLRSARKLPLETATPSLPSSIRRPLNPFTLRPLSSAQSPSKPTNSLPNPPNPLTPKIWLSGKLSPPPPPPPPPPPSPPIKPLEHEPNDGDPPASGSFSDSSGFRVIGKIFIGNLTKWLKKKDIVEFFRQFGPVKKVELIKDHDDPERNLGYCFLFYGGPTAEDSAASAVEFNGMEFHGRVLTVRLDDGNQLREREEERMRWVEGSDKREYRSKWHEDRDIASSRFQKVLDTKTEDWQAVVSAFEKIPKVQILILFTTHFCIRSTLSAGGLSN